MTEKQTILQFDEVPQMRIMPFEKLMAEYDAIQYRSSKCLFPNCTKEPINSHTLSDNFLNKISNDLTKVIMLQPNILPIFKNQDKERLKNLVRKKFSTFPGFCVEHDNSIFQEIDNFDGTITPYKAVLVHYRNICYGICHIKTQILRLSHLKKQNYTAPTNEEADKVWDLINSKKLMYRLEYCLNKHLETKTELEKILKSQDFSRINFYTLKGPLLNPVFSGRTTEILVKNKIFQYPGYISLPWVSYMTLLTDNNNYLVFCWLKKDKKHLSRFKYFLAHNTYLDVVKIIAYGYSDSLAMERDFYEKHSIVIEKTIKKYRVY